VPGWRFVKKFDAYGLDREIQKSGWTFFSPAEVIQATVFGIDVQKMVCRAIERILRDPKSERFNSLEIERIVSKHILGVPYTTVYAHSRHVQKSIILFRDEDVQQWDQIKIFSGVIPSVGRANGKDVPLEGTFGQPSAATS
jgi:hypothetical protein